jgi:peptidyl-prolyl cis-trans isomerase B (cyclophilin B)
MTPRWTQASLWIGISLLLAGCSGTAPDAPREPAPPPAPAAAPAPAPLPASNTAVLMTTAGEITLELLPDVAPETVAQFKRLAAEGFYDGTTFHRVIKDSLIQGGDPLSRDMNPSNDGEGTAGSFIKAEINATPMKAGAVAMAHPGDPNAASCQFFICVKDHPEWMGQFTVFARVSDGMDTVRKISRASVGTGALSEHPIFKQTIERIVFK